jgi:hypothetical protein
VPGLQRGSSCKLVVIHAVVDMIIAAEGISEAATTGGDAG